MRRLPARKRRPDREGDKQADYRTYVALVTSTRTGGLRRVPCAGWVKGVMGAPSRPQAFEPLGL